MSHFSSNDLTVINIDHLLNYQQEDLDVFLDDAGTLLESLPDKEQPSLAVWKITRLGMPSKKPEKDELPILSDILAANKESFCVGFRGSRNEGAAYFLGMKEDSSGVRIQGALQAAFGMAQTAPMDDKNFNYEHWGVCKRIILNEDQLDQLPKASDITSSWVDSLAYSAFNKNCEIRLLFTPLKTEWLDEKIDEAYKLLGILSENQENSLQVSHSGGLSVNSNGNGLERLKDFIFASKKANDNENTSVSLNLKKEHWNVTLVSEELQFRIRELKQLKRDGGWSLSVIARADKEADIKIVEQIIGGLFIKLGYQCNWTNYYKGSAMLLTSAQVVRYVHHPENFFPGIELEPLRSFEANAPRQDKPALKAGYLVWNGQKIVSSDAISSEEKEKSMIAIPLKDLNSHAFICGKSGSGKTNSVCSLLSKLQEKGIPFMVIEPVKGEYRSLKNIMPELKIFNLEIHGKNQLHINPFWFPKRGKLSYHIDSLKSIITASFELEAAMPNILEQCLVSSYVKKGWNISTSQNVFSGKIPDEMLYPTFTTLCNEIELYLETNAGFGAELKSNYRGALLSRLKSYTTGTKGMLLNCPAHPDFENWIENNISCVIELDELADDSDKAIVMGTLLTQYFQCIKYSGNHIRSELKHVIVLEEAHHLFKDSGNSVDAGNSNRQHLVEMLSNMLAEIRAYGEGIFIVDQSPTTVSAQVIKNTAVKLVHYTDYVEDLKVLSECLLLESEDENAPAALKIGHALLRFSSMQRPVHIQMPLCDTKENGGIKGDICSSSDDARNILDMICSDESVHKKLLDKCRMFINHFLFDELQSKCPILDSLKADINSEAIIFGCGAGITEEGVDFILRKLIAESLSVMYPNQYLLCRKLQISVERYIDVTACLSDDAQNILDMIRSNEIVHKKLLNKCHRFINHFLFDEPQNKCIALNMLQEYVITEAICFGYDQETLDSVTNEGMEYILRNLITESLSTKYPNQYLFCGRLQMAVERYLELTMLQSTGITRHQILLVEQYISEVLIASLSYYYGSAAEYSRIISAIPKSRMQLPYLSDILLSMVKILEKGTINVEVLFSLPAEEAVWSIGENIFLLPVSKNLAERLILLLKDCYDDMK